LPYKEAVATLEEDLAEEAEDLEEVAEEGAGQEPS